MEKTETKARRLFPRPVMNCLDNVVALPVAMLETPPVPFCRAVILGDLKARKMHTGNSALTKSPSTPVTRSSASFSPRHTLNILLVHPPGLWKHPEEITADRNKRSWAAHRCGSLAKRLEILDPPNTSRRTDQPNPAGSRLALRRVPWVHGCVERWGPTTPPQGTERRFLLLTTREGRS